MPLRKLASLIEVFTPDRARTYAMVSLVIALLVVVSSFVETPERLAEGTDFPAFYNAGRILKESSGTYLYDRDLQRKLYLEIAPGAANRQNLFFVYTPFFASVFLPLALFSYQAAFVCWMLISAGLFAAGFLLIWAAASLPSKHRLDGFLVALAFLPFLTWCLFTGQTSAFGFFWLALAIYLDRKGWMFASGCALAVLLYKPTLLILLVPMLIITKRWRSLAGFTLTAAGLGLISYSLIGSSGFPKYVNMLATFSQDKASGRHPNWADIDAYSFFLPLTDGRIALAQVLTACVGLVVLPFLLSAWIRHPERAWATAITWTLVLNIYVLIYDATFIILAVVLSIAPWVLFQGKLPLSLRWLVLALFLVPWVETNLALHYGFHPMTVVLVAFGCYQLFESLKGQEGTLDRAPS